MIYLVSPKHMYPAQQVDEFLSCVTVDGKPGVEVHQRVTLGHPIIKKHECVYCEKKPMGVSPSSRLSETRRQLGFMLLI